MNSNWTRNHIDQIWAVPDKTKIVYPPCDTQRLVQYDIAAPRERIILSIAQFRPEKNHLLQLLSLNEYIKKYEDNSIKLVLVGSSRNEEDAKESMN